MSDYTDYLAAAENALRRIIERVGLDSHGSVWLTRFGVPTKTQQRWRRALEQEAARRAGGISEDRLIYFSDFADLEAIIVANWPSFEPVFGDKDRTLVYFKKLRELRNPDAHHRALSDSEKSLVTGMSGEIRTLVTRYLSTRDTPDEYFPKLESIRDNLGNHFGRGGPAPVVRVGDIIEFVAEGWDPEGAALEYRWVTQPPNPEQIQEWSPENRFTWTIHPLQVANPAWVTCEMRGPRAPHAEGHRDAGWTMLYTVLPSRV